MIAATSEGTLLGGRITYRQKLQGYRTGIEPILLAACVPARPGDRVVEGGTGAAPGLLALNARIPGIIGLGIERDPDMAELAVANLALNIPNSLKIQCDPLEEWTPDGAYDHTFANPPWHLACGTPPLDPGRHAAKRASDNTLPFWIRALSTPLRRRGTLTLVLPAASFSQAIAALATCHCKQITLLPLWPHAGEPAKLIIVQAIHEGRGASRILPGLVLHEADGTYTPQVNGILRDGAGLVL